MNNLYQVKKHTVTEKGTDKVLSVYYSVGRYKKWFFGLFGSYVWRECNELHYRKHGDGGYYSTTSCNFHDYNSAVEICNDLNKILIETCEYEEIVYKGRDISE
jgi:hypothetical protein